MRLGELLVARGVVTPDRVEQALDIQAKKGGLIGELLVGLRALTEEQMYEGLATQLGLPFLAELPAEIDPELIRDIPLNYAKQSRSLPVGRQNGAVHVVTADPLNTELLDDLRGLLQSDMTVSVAPHFRILNAINHLYSSADSMSRDLSGQSFEEIDAATDEIEDLLESAGDAPIIRFVNNTLFRAVRDRASDVHIEPYEKDVAVRFRVDGALLEITRVPKAAQASITSRIKIMGNLNIAEKRLPQDGRIRIKIAGRDVDIRLSTLPTAHGERIVMRLLDRSAALLSLTDIGFNPEMLRRFEKVIQLPHGIVLVTGPTGSGKTTTLYAGLCTINTPEKNIITVEDPVEYQIAGVGQIPVNPKINLTFARGLRAILRQDPDVIMVGEIRDLETAEIAIQASLTGHLVFSTIHTNDAASTITRLVDMGVEPFLVATSVEAILAQRLIRLLCTSCKRPYHPEISEMIELGLDPTQFDGPPIFYRPQGCSGCMDTGYTGRTGIYEFLVVSDAIRSLILNGTSVSDIKRQAIAEGMLTLKMDGANKVLQGITSTEEVLRKAQEEIVVD